VTPVRTLSPSERVTWPTSTPGTSVIALLAPGSYGPKLRPRSRARGRELAEGALVCGVVSAVAGNTRRKTAKSKRAAVELANNLDWIISRRFYGRERERVNEWPSARRIEGGTQEKQNCYQGQLKIPSRARIAAGSSPLLGVCYCRGLGRRTRRQKFWKNRHRN